MRYPPKPKYHVNQVIVGRTNHVGDNFPNETVMIEVDSARYESNYGHWVYCGSLWHLDDNGTVVEIYEHDVLYRFKG